MALSQKLEFRQTQSLVMTPQLMQAIKLLQLSTLDLAAFVEAELERNPLLERDDAPDGEARGPLSDEARQDRATTHEDAGASPSERGETERVAADLMESERGAGDGLLEAAGPTLERGDGDLDASGDFDGGEGFDRDLAQVPGGAEPDAGGLDVALSDLFPDDPRTGGGEADPLDPSRLTGEAWVGGGGIGLDDGDLDGFAATRPILRDHLAAQLSLAVRDPVRRMIGQALIDAVDDNGYLRAEIDDIADQLGTDASLVGEVLRLVQAFEPAGIAARSLAECLALQLAERNRLDPAMQTLLDHLELVARKDRARLKRLCGVEDDDLDEMLAEITALDPKPGLAFAPVDAVQTVIPDILVQPTAEGYRVELNTEALPRVLVNRSYHAAVVRKAKTPAEKTYYADCLQTANWLVKSLDQRARTILKVATEIVRQQDGFFRHGVAHLRPLNLKTVAAETAMHESTVSRVTANKYMATTRGIFELKFFFTAAIASADGGEAHSAEAVRHRIRQLIDAESPSAVLSDDAIVQKLHEDGIEIARRTVAKYRESMKISSSMERRREKMAGQRIA